MFGWLEKFIEDDEDEEDGAVNGDVEEVDIVDDGETIEEMLCNESLALAEPHESYELIIGLVSRLVVLLLLVDEDDGVAVDCLADLLDDDDIPFWWSEIEAVVVIRPWLLLVCWQFKSFFLLKLLFTIL